MTRTREDDITCGIYREGFWLSNESIFNMAQSSPKWNINYKINGSNLKISGSNSLVMIRSLPISIILLPHFIVNTVFFNCEK